MLSLLSVFSVAALLSPASMFCVHAPVVRDGGWQADGQESYLIKGDWIISQPTWFNNTTISLYGNLTVISSGSLTLKNVSLWLNSSYNGQYCIKVEPGGKFFMGDNDDDASTNNDASVLNSSTYNYLFVAEQNSDIVAMNSEVHRCGIASNPPTESGFVVFANNSAIKGCLFSQNYDGVVISASHCSLENNTIASNSNYGIQLYKASNNTVIFNNISGNTRGISISNSEDNRIEYNICSNNYDTGIFLKASNNYLAHNNMNSNGNGMHFHIAYFNTVADTIFKDNMCGVMADCYSKANPVLNSTILSSVGNDIVACDEVVIDLLNTTYEPLKISCDPTSAIMVWNFLDIFVFDFVDRPLCGATVSIKQNLTETYNITTDSSGSVRCLPVQYAFYNKSNVPIINTTSAHVLYRNLSFGNNPRVLDMSLSRTEIFRYGYVLPYIQEEKKASPMIIYAKGEELQPQECRVSVTLTGKGNFTKETGPHSGTCVSVVETLPPYIQYVPGTISNSSVKLQNNSDGSTTLNWTLGTLRINDTWSVEYNISSTLGGKEVSIGSYPYSCVNYTMWNATNISQPFLNLKIAVILIQKTLLPLSPLNQIATVNSTLHLEVLVVNKTNMPVEGVVVNFSIVLFPPDSTGQGVSGNLETSSSGVANATFYLGNRTGLYSVRSLCKGAGNELIFNVTATPDVVSHIQITPSSFKIVVGSERQFYAIGFDRFDNLIDDPLFNWDVVGGIGTVTNGLFKAEHTGTGFIEAWNGSVAGSAAIEVLPDTYMPRIVSYKPQGEGVPLSSEIVMLFNESMNKSGTETGFSIEPWTEGKFNWSGNNEMHFIPSSNLSPATTYRIRLNSSRVKDINGNNLDGNGNGTYDGVADDIVWEFITNDTLQPYVLDYSPTGYDIGVKTLISAVFSEPMNRTATENSFKLTDVEGKTVDGAFRWLDADTKLEFLPDSQLIDKMEYRVTIEATAKDLNDNPLDGNRNGIPDGSTDRFTWSFTVGLKGSEAEPDMTNVMIAEVALIIVFVLILFLARGKFWRKKKDKTKLKKRKKQRKDERAEKEETTIKEEEKIRTEQGEEK